jgi:hypothetical protein
MSIVEKLFKRKKNLSLDEVRIEEKRMELKESQIVKKLEGLDRQKEEIFKNGAQTKSKALRRIYARKFEEATKVMQLEERELIQISKEIRLLSRIRMVLERSQKTTSAIPLLERLNESQVHELMKLIDTDTVKEAEFMEKVDLMLGLTEREEATGEMGEEGMEVMKVWEQMDDGQSDFEEGLKQATRAVMKKPPEKEEDGREAEANP